MLQALWQGSNEQVGNAGADYVGHLLIRVRLVTRPRLLRPTDDKQWHR